MIADYPKTRHIPLLRALWKEAFGDSDLFLDGFFTHGFDCRRCRCILEDDVPVSALYWFGITRDGQRFAYLYAVATAAASRGRGLFSALLEDTKQVLLREGFDGILLVPESEALARMYGKLGFSPCAPVDLRAVEAAENASPVREIGAGAYMELRRELLPSGCAQPGADMLEFLASQYRFWASEGCLAAGQVYEGKLVCQEYLGDEAAAGGLARALDASRARLRMPGKAVPFAQFLPLRERCAPPDYFPFALD